MLQLNLSSFQSTASKVFYLQLNCKPHFFFLNGSDIHTFVLHSMQFHVYHFLCLVFFDHLLFVHFLFIHCLLINIFIRSFVFFVFLNFCPPRFNTTFNSQHFVQLYIFWCEPKLSLALFSATFHYFLVLFYLFLFVFLFVCQKDSI